MSLRVVFAGTPDFAIEPLKALLNSQHQIIAVYTQPDRPAGRGRTVQSSPIKQLSLQHHLLIYQPEHLKDPEVQEELRKLNPDLIIVVAYGLILPRAVLEIPKYGCINIHASLLPRWRGAAPIQHAILAGDNTTGVSIMQMDASLDTGDVLLTRSCAIDSTDTSKSLQDKLGILGASTLIETLEKLELGKLSPQKQDSHLANYAHKISKEDAKINWAENAQVLDRKIRAYNPWPIAFTELNGQPIRIWKATPLSTPTTNTKPGIIINIDKDSIDIATGEGILKLLELQLPGGKKLPVTEILKSKSAWFQVGLILT